MKGTKLAALVLSAFLACSVTGVHAFANVPASAEADSTETEVTASRLGEDINAGSSVPDQVIGADGKPLTPEGNLSLVDDIITESGKQFITKEAAKKAREEAAARAEQEKAEHAPRTYRIGGLELNGFQLFIPLGIIVLLLSVGAVIFLRRKKAANAVKTDPDMDYDDAYDDEYDLEETDDTEEEEEEFYGDEEEDYEEYE